VLTETKALCPGTAAGASIGRRLRRRGRLLLGNEDGAELVEFAIAAHVLLALMFGLMVVCIALYTQQMLSEVAREGTRYGIVHGSTCVTPSSAVCTATAAQVQAAAVTENWPNPGGTVTVVATFPDGNQAPGSRVKVVASSTLPFRIPFVSTSALSESSSSVMYIVQ